MGQSLPTCASTMCSKYTLLLVYSVLASCVSAATEDEELTRDPYQYQLKVEDDKTSNSYEISETGSPDLVVGSYRIALPDGRTQIVTYEVHPDKGFDAKVSYEGTAQYPDTPNYVPSPYGPPEPIRPGYAKYKRQSQHTASKRKIGRKVQIESKPKKTAFKSKEVVDTSPDLLTASSENSYFKNQKTNEDKKREHKVKKEVATSYDDTEESPQAEPLSLQQHSKPPASAKRRQEFKPPQPQEKAAYKRTKDTSAKGKPSVNTVEFLNSETIPTPLIIHEAVPTSANPPTVHHSGSVTGYHQGQHLALPGEASDDLVASVFSETNQNQAIRNLEKTEPENRFPVAQPVNTYHSESTGHETKAGLQPVSKLNELTNAGRSTAGGGNPSNVFVEHFTEETGKPILENIPETSNPIEFRYKSHEYSDIKFHDVSNELTKNHKKRKVNINDYFETGKDNHQPEFQNVNILPTIYRSQIKWKSTFNQKNEQSNTKSHEKSVDDGSSVEDSTNIVIPDIVIDIEKSKLSDYNHFDEKKSTIEITETKLENDNSIPRKPKDDPKITKVEEKKLIISSLPILTDKELYQTIFEESPPVTTRRPKYKIICKARVPRQFKAALISHKPVPRGEKAAGFVPEYVPRY